MNSKAWFMVLTCLAVSPVMAPAQIKSCSQPSLVEFDAPGASPAPGLGTLVFAINDLGEVVGWYQDANAVYHAVLRTADGKITSYEAPGANTSGANHGTSALSINAFGAITGRFALTGLGPHGYVRTRDGRFTIFEAPDAAAIAGYGTTASSINPQGATSGVYVDAGGTQHGFVRSPTGVITEFDPSGSVETDVCEETCLSLAGEIAGSYLDAGNNYHGFLRARDGKITVFDAPGADATSGNYNGTFPTSINLEGTITGFLWDLNYVAHGFVRTPNGHFTTFDDPSAGATPGNGLGTYPNSINALGGVTGDFIDADYLMHGFYRSPRGTFFTIDAPGAGNVIGSYQGTAPIAINLFGTVAGYYVDQNNGNHSFVWTPPCGGF